MEQLPKLYEWMDEQNTLHTPLWTAMDKRLQAHHIKDWKVPDNALTDKRSGQNKIHLFVMYLIAGNLAPHTNICRIVTILTYRDTLECNYTGTIGRKKEVELPQYTDEGREWAIPMILFMCPRVQAVEDMPITFTTI